MVKKVDIYKMWTFGFGSNMNVGNVESKKGHKVIDYVTGSVEGYNMCFNLSGIPKVEPAFANAVEGTTNDSIHGVAIKLSEEDMAKLDDQERGYEKTNVTVNGYDGRKVEGCSMYIKRHGNFLPTDLQTPSPRYLNLLIDGAVESGLDPQYIDRLRYTKTYTADENTILRRKTLPAPESLSPISAMDLFSTKADSLGTNLDTYSPQAGKFAHVAVLGYIFKMPRSRCYFNSHLGRDITSRSLRHFRGLPLDKNDDMGMPPYPELDLIKPEEKEYLYTWLDHYIEKGDVVGYLLEYLKQCTIKHSESKV